jgi:hypothetical protein
MKLGKMWIVVFFVLLSGCAPVAEECEVCEECEVNPFPEGLVLPQVFIMTKLNYTTEDLTALKTNVVDPLVAYFETLDQTVVSIYIDNDNRGGLVKQTFTIEVIISDNDGNADPIYYGFLHSKVDGVIPVWVMETME